MMQAVQAALCGVSGVAALLLFVAGWVGWRLGLVWRSVSFWAIAFFLASVAGVALGQAVA